MHALQSPGTVTGKNDFMATAPIGVFDSGAGGLSILKGIHQLLPGEQLLYVADSAHAPYGPRGDAFIRARCKAIMDFFLDRGAKAVVVACNTATAAAIVELRAQHSLPIVGVEPAVKPAALSSRSGVVGVLATSGTIASDKFLHLKSRFHTQVEIITSPCAGLVEAIEDCDTNAPVLHVLLETIIAPMLGKGVDTLVLGCTHYSLIREAVAAVAGPAVAIVDAGDAVARELQRRLAEAGMLQTRDSGEPGSVEFFTSGDTERQRILLSRYWGQTLTVLPLPEQ
jgi:glutamate racemase